MRKQKLGKDLQVSVVGLGCMGMTHAYGKPADKEEMKKLIVDAVKQGCNFFDTAECYIGINDDGSIAYNEELVGEALAPYRHEVIIATKCGIRHGENRELIMDARPKVIRKSIEGSLKRLKTDYVDILLLHRPDALMEPEEVAEAFEILEKSGKVKVFGVSNHNPMQIELLNQYCGGKICIDQIQFSAAHCPTIDAGLNVNIHNDAGCDRDGGIIEYARLKKMTLQAWSPFQYGMFEGIFIGNEKFPELNKVLDRLAEKYGVTQNAIAVAWIMRHPAGIQTIVGSTNLKRIQDISKASDIVLSREEWYEIYLAAGKMLP